MNISQLKLRSEKFDDDDNDDDDEDDNDDDDDDDNNNNNNNNNLLWSVLTMPGTNCRLTSCCNGGEPSTIKYMFNWHLSC